jgi:hypothetical protein
MKNRGGGVWAPMEISVMYVLRYVNTHQEMIFCSSLLTDVVSIIFNLAEMNDNNVCKGSTFLHYRIILSMSMS